MHRLFLPSQKIAKDKITISDQGQLHHMRDVLRFREGKLVTVFDEKQNEYICKIEELDKTAVLSVKEKLPLKNADIEVTVACAIPKKAKIEDVIDKLTQLGVKKIIPLITERVIVRMDKEKSRARLMRWRKIAQSASLQSQRNSIPVIEEVSDLKGVLAQSAGYGLKIIPTLIKGRKPLKEVLSRTKAKNIIVLIGPEGDFTAQEVEAAIDSGFIAVTLGDTVLRVDTACIAVASFLRLNENY